MADEETLGRVVAELKSTYMTCDGGKFNLEVQVPHLAKLADHYMEQYRKSGDWVDVLKAHSLFNSAAARQPNDETFQKRAFKAQEEYWKQEINIDYEQQKVLTARLIDELEVIRTKTRGNLEKAKSAATRFEENDPLSEKPVQPFFEEMKNISITSTRAMITLAEQVIKESIDCLRQQPPCSFSVVALGSLAKGEATPYSDLEYLFLIQIKDEKTIQYFERLALTTYFLIGNMKETKLSYMNIKELKPWFEDMHRNGFKIDGLADSAGNIPTGNGKEIDRNRFIVTPEGLLNMYREKLNNPDTNEAMRGDLTAMLHYTTQIFSYGEGGDALLSWFNNEKAKLSMNQARKDINTQMFLADAKKYNFSPDGELSVAGFTVDIKKDLYRYPSICLFNTSIITGIKGGDSWDTLRLLYEYKVISPSFYVALRLMLSCACFIRLSAYLDRNSHSDQMSLLCSYRKKTDFQARRWYMEQRELFIAFCNHMLPVKQAISSSTCILETFKSDVEHKWWVSMQIYYYCNDMRNTRRVCEGFIDLKGNVETAITKISREIRDNSTMLDVIHMVAKSILEKSREPELSLTYYQHLEQMIHQLADGDDKCLRMLRVLNGMAKCYFYLRDEPNTQSIHRKFLELNKDNSIFSDIQMKGIVKHKQAVIKIEEKKFQDAERCILEALTIYTHSEIKLPTDVPISDHLTVKELSVYLKNFNNASPIVAKYLTTLGVIYQRQDLFNFAESCHRKALDLLENFYGTEASHQDFVSVLVNLARCLKMQDAEQEAVQAYQRAIERASRRFGSVSAVESSLHDSPTLEYLSSKMIMGEMFWMRRSDAK